MGRGTKEKQVSKRKKRKSRNESEAKNVKAVSSMEPKQIREAGKECSREGERKTKQHLPSEEKR